tara:strand:+ start:332 stop:733 length:402 start_codon:yes stop_codon:yes gene_type:complete
MGSIIEGLKKASYREVTIDGIEEPLVLRRLSPADLFECVGSIWASIEKGPKGKRGKKEVSQEDMVEQFRAAERIVIAGTVDPANGHGPLFDEKTVGLLTADMLGDLSAAIMQASGMAEGAAELADHFPGNGKE